MRMLFFTLLLGVSGCAHGLNQNYNVSENEAPYCIIYPYGAPQCYFYSIEVCNQVARVQRAGRCVMR